MRRALLPLCLFLACERYEPPPTPDLIGLEGSTLSDPKAPLVIDFGKAIVPATLDTTIAFYDTDLEGNLPDEDDDPDSELRVLFHHSTIDGDRGGHIDYGDTSISIVPDGAMPVGPKLVLIFEAGLTAQDGRVVTYRVKIPFSYAVKCTGKAGGTKLASGVYFLLLEVEQPLGTQIQLFGAIDVDPASGLFVGQFTNADRNPDPNRCPTPCDSSDACRLLPAPACVPPSTKAGTIDEHTDFVPNNAPPTGYSFLVEGCAVDQDNGAAVLTAPAAMVVQQPPVTIGGLTMTALFGPDAKGVVRASGSLAADVVSLGGNKIGPGKGTMSAVLVPPNEVPPGVPQPPKPTSDAGAKETGP